jgi:hypothetical protein
MVIEDKKFVETIRERAIGVLNWHAAHLASSAERDDIRYVLEYLNVIEARASYLTGKVDQYERYLEKIAADGNVPPSLRATVRETLPSHPHREGQVPLMTHCDSGLKGGTATSENRRVALVKNLNQPCVISRPGAVKVNGEPEPVLNAASVKGGEMLGCLDGDKAGRGHSSSGPWVEKTLSLDDATNRIEETHGDVLKMIDAEHEHDRISASRWGVPELADHKRRWVRHAVAEYVRLLHARISRNAK